MHGVLACIFRPRLHEAEVARVGEGVDEDGQVSGPQQEHGQGDRLACARHSHEQPALFHGMPFFEIPVTITFARASPPQ